MVATNYERLSAQDLQLLVLESPSTPMHIVSTEIYRNGPLIGDDGGVDINAFRDHVDAILHRIPRYRKKLKWISYADIPVWIDDTSFNLEYHIRHTALPRPGSTEQLKNLTARILERSLDRERPLWELWLVEGLPGRRYAIISKIHYCMLSSLDGLSINHVLMSQTPEQIVPQAPPFVPGKAPSEVSLLWDEWNRRYAQPIDALRNAGELLRRPREGIGELEKRLGAVRNSLSSMIRRPPDTPVNGELSVHRRVEWLRLPLKPLTDFTNGGDWSLTTVLLGLLAGGIYKLFEARQFDLKNSEFNLAIPVTGLSQTRSTAADGIVTWVVQLPVDEPDLQTRMRRIDDELSRLGGRAGANPELLVDVAARVPAGLLSLFTTGRSSCANALMTGVANAPRQMYSMGAEKAEIYTHLPLMSGAGLSTLLTTYNGNVFWAFNGDYDLLPDLSLVEVGVSESYQALVQPSGGKKPAAKSRRRGSQRKRGSRQDAGSRGRSSH